MLRNEFSTLFTFLLFNLIDRVRIRAKGKLTFCNKPNSRCFDPLEPLNDDGTRRPHSNATRAIFKGYYENDIEVAIQRMVKNGFIKSMNEIEREFQILRHLNNHENFIRYFCYEMDDLEDFV